jgi:hypothetical protein
LTKTVSSTGGQRQGVVEARTTAFALLAILATLAAVISPHIH